MEVQQGAGGRCAGACALSADHPPAERPEIALAGYLDPTHVIVGTTGERQTAIERRLEALGTRRRAGPTVPCHSLAVLSVLGNGLILTLPSRLLAEQRPAPGLLPPTTARGGRRPNDRTAPAPHPHRTRLAPAPHPHRRDPVAPSPGIRRRVRNPLPVPRSWPSMMVR